MSVAVTTLKLGHFFVGRYEVAQNNCAYCTAEVNCEKVLPSAQLKFSILYAADGGGVPFPGSRLPDGTVS
jgi:hypothetical protein